MEEHEREELTKTNAKLKEKLLQRIQHPGDQQTVIENMVLLWSCPAKPDTPSFATNG